MARRTLVSLFTGAGGLDIGLEAAGFDTVVATDVDADCVATLEANKGLRLPISAGSRRRYLQRAGVVHARIQDLEPSDLRPRAVGSRWFPDLMAGGPPCQPFSSSGKLLSVEDPRGRLFEHFVRLAKGLRPRALLFENVRGLVTARGPSGKPGEALTLVKRAFEGIGYATSFALLNAADFGMPQRRVRLFMVGMRTGPLPQFPAPTHGEKAGAWLFADPTLPWATLGDFLKTQGNPAASDVIRPTAELARQLAHVHPGSGLRSAGARETTRPGGHWGYRQGTFIADPALPARTVTAAASQDWIRGADGSLRRLTWEECSALQGFPQDWQFTGNLASRHRQIGNAVPAVFGQVIGRSILEALKSKGRRRAESAPLPAEFAEAIAYTSREQGRNGESRRRAAELLAAGADPQAVKGVGTHDRAYSPA